MHLIVSTNEDVFLQLKNLKKSFGETTAVNDVSIQIKKGELVSFIGPSGCGKTTLLRVIGGFHQQNDGEIIIDNKKIDHLPPEKRPTGMVFQNYALFPHMSIYQNVEYGLKIQKMNKAERDKQIKKALSQVQLESYLERKPSELSGGQQQRVAIARCLVLQPKVLLLDEPLSNLDAKLRIIMREEIRRLKEELDLTIIFVTHDQEEALSISDRVVVLNKGSVQQIDKPNVLYNNPTNEFVADFVGSTNVLKGNIVEEKNSYYFTNENVTFPIEKTTNNISSKEQKIVIRPERIKLDSEGSVKGVVERVVYNGNFTRYFIKVSSLNIMVDEFNIVNSIRFKEGDLVGILFPTSLHYIN